MYREQRHHLWYQYLPTFSSCVCLNGGTSCRFNRSCLCFLRLDSRGSLLIHPGMTGPSSRSQCFPAQPHSGSWHVQDWSHGLNLHQPSTSHPPHLYRVELDPALMSESLSLAWARSAFGVVCHASTGRPRNCTSWGARCLARWVRIAPETSWTRGCPRQLSMCWFAPGTRNRCRGVSRAITSARVYLGASERTGCTRSKHCWRRHESLCAGRLGNQHTFYFLPPVALLVRLAAPTWRPFR